MICLFVMMSDMSSWTTLRVNTESLFIYTGDGCPQWKNKKSKSMETTSNIFFEDDIVLVAKSKEELSYKKEC